MLNDNNDNFDERLYGVLDEKLSAFRFKFFCATDKGAEREFGDAVNNPKSVFAQHPEDFTLYKLADFDTASGLSRPVVPALYLGRASDFVVVNKPSEVSHD